MSGLHETSWQQLASSSLNSTCSFHGCKSESDLTALFFTDLAREAFMVVAVFSLSWSLWQRTKAATRAARSPSKVKSKSVAVRGPKSSEHEACSPPVVRVNRDSCARIDTAQPCAVAASPAELRAVDGVQAARAAKACEQQILQQLADRKFTPALSVYRQAEREGLLGYFGEELFSSFLQSAIRVGKLDVVERIFQRIHSSSMKMSNGFFHTALKLLASRKHFDTSIMLHQIFGEDLPCDRVILSCLVNASLEAGQLKLAAHLLDQNGSRIDAEQNDYVLFFRTYVAVGDVDSAEALLMRLGAKASTLMLNLSLLTCVNANQLDRALSIMDSVRFKKILDVVSFNTVLKALSQRPDGDRCKSCLDFYRKMLSIDVQPDEATYSILLGVCIAENRGVSVWEIARALLDNGRALDASWCTSMIKGLLRADCLQGALEVFEGMKTASCAYPDIMTFSMLLKALIDNKNMTAAIDLLEDVRAAGFQPDDIMVTHLLEGCRQVGNVDLGLKFYEDYVATENAKPSQYLLTALLKLHCRRGDDGAHEVLLNWEEKHGWRPSVLHYTCAMSGVLRLGHEEQAWKTYQLMRSRGGVPDEKMLATMLQGMVAARRWKWAVALAEDAQNLEVQLPSEPLTAAMTQMVASGEALDEARRLRVLMNSTAAATARPQNRPS